MQLVVLAAGKGCRLGKSLPKALVDIAVGKPYLHYQLLSFQKFNFSQKIIVGGFAFSEVRKFIEGFSHTDVTLIENKNFDKGSLLSLLCTQHQVTFCNDDMFLFNADHYYSLETYKKIFSATHKNIVIFCDRDRALGGDDMKVRAQDDRLVTMSKVLATHGWGYVGVTFVPHVKQRLYFQAAQEVRKHQGDLVSVEVVLNALAKTGEFIYLVDISGSWWTEVDTPEDLFKASQVIESHE